MYQQRGTVTLIHRCMLYAFNLSDEKNQDDTLKKYLTITFERAFFFNYIAYKHNSWYDILHLHISIKKDTMIIYINI